MNCGSGCECKTTPQLRANRGGTAKGIALAQLGQLLDYPDDGFFLRLEKIGASVLSVYPLAAKPLKKFKNLCSQMSEAQLEELYTRTFDLAAIVSPYITGYIYGDENFDRGTLMAQLSENYQRLGFELEGELPDHLAKLLRFSNWLDEETLDELISFCLEKPVKEMCEQLKSSDNTYFFLLSAIDIVLNSAPSGESKS